jgi:hypothetical protein
MGLGPLTLLPSLLDIFHVSYTNRQLHEEATHFLYASLNVVIGVPGFHCIRYLNSAIGPTNWSALTSLTLHMGFLCRDFFENSDAWIMICDLENLSRLHIEVYSDVLDVTALQDARLRTRFARQLSLPGLRDNWEGDEERAMNLAENHLNCLFRIAQSLVGQVKDASAKRLRSKVLSVRRSLGWRAAERAESLGHDALQRVDYDEIAASIMPRIERELEEAGCFE